MRGSITTMVNPQLIDYIRRQVAAGVSQDDISKALVAIGWETAAIQEGFASVSTSSPVGLPPLGVQMPVQSPLESGNPRHIGRWVAIISIVLLLLIAAGAYAAYSFNLFTLPGVGAPIPKVIPTKKSATTTAAVAPLPLATTTASTTQTTATVSSNATSTKTVATSTASTALSCTTQDCFNTQFALCNKAMLTVDSGILGVAQYSIIGPVSGGCSMSFVFTKHLNTTWVNKPMTCTYDNKIEFTAAVQNVFTAAQQGKSACTGPLTSILKSLPK